MSEVNKAMESNPVVREMFGLDEKESKQSKEIQALKAHAVEVLAIELWAVSSGSSQFIMEPHSWKTLIGDEQNKYIKEARALLGWDNDNDKEKEQCN